MEIKSRLTTQRTAVETHNFVFHSLVANRILAAIFDASQCGPYNVCYFPSAHTFAVASYINY